jgi:hypothetical protein
MILLLLLPWLGLFPWPWAVGGVALEPPVCSAVGTGSVACIGERLCRCGYARGGSTIEEPAGYRWDCGVLRPYCHRPPASAPRDDVFDDLLLYLPAAPLLPERPVKRPLQPGPVARHPP